MITNTKTKQKSTLYTSNDVSPNLSVVKKYYMYYV